MVSFDFGQTVGTLRNALDGASATHAAMSENIANANTPGYHRKEVSFKDALAAAEAPADGDLGGEDLVLTTDDARDLVPDGSRRAGAPFTISTTVADDQQMRVDGSNVDVDQEMAKLSLNSEYAQTMGQLLQNQYARLRQAIQERF